MHTQSMIPKPYFHRDRLKTVFPANRQKLKYTHGKEKVWNVKVSFSLGVQQPILYTGTERKINANTIKPYIF